MSDLTFNKVAGAVLATGLAIFGLRELSSGIFSNEKVEKPGFAVEVAAETGGDAAAAEVPPDWGTVLPTADVAAGKAVFAKCQSCHTDTNGGANGTGPNLWGILGHKPATKAGFAYSPAMQAFAAKQPVWDYEHVYEFVKSPAKYVPGTKMTFVGLKQQQDRINLIAYLHSQGSTLPIPAPNPAAAAATVAAAGNAPAPGAAAEGSPTATGATAVPATGAGGPAGQGEGAPTPGAPAEQKAPTAQR